MITPIDHGLDYIGKSRGIRAPGVHMSDLYNSYFQELYPKKYDKSRPMNPMHLEMGLAWEDMLEDGLKERMVSVAGEDIERPGEFTTATGIHYNPDLLIYSDGPTRLGEIKLTWMSSREMPTDVEYGWPVRFQKYDMQMKSYALWLGLLHARLYVFHVNGAYSWMAKKKVATNARDAAKQAAEEQPSAGGPQLLAFDIEYTQHELDENWLLMESHGKSRGLLDAKGNAIHDVSTAAGSH